MGTVNAVHSTYVIERSYSAAPERVFGAFADPAKKRRWFGERSGRGVEVFEMDFRVGGADQYLFRMQEGTPFPGVALVNHTSYQDIVPGSRIVLAYTMTLGDRRISASLVTLEFLAEQGGTRMVFTEQAAFFEGADGPALREDGWKKLLDGLSAELGQS